MRGTEGEGLLYPETLGTGVMWIRIFYLEHIHGVCLGRR